MLRGEFTKKRKALAHWPRLPPVSDCSFPSRLRAISLASKNGERGKSRAIAKDRANKFAALLKSHREPTQLVRRPHAYCVQEGIFLAGAGSIFVHGSPFVAW